MRLPRPSSREFAGYWEYLLERAIFTARRIRSGRRALIGGDGSLIGSAHCMCSIRAAANCAATSMVVPIDLLPLILDDI
jgi:hypothetical protein